MSAQLCELYTLKSENFVICELYLNKKLFNKNKFNKNPVKVLSRTWYDLVVSLVAQNSPAMWETQARSLAREDLLEKEMG